FLRDCLTPGETLAAIDARIDKGEATPALLLRSASGHFEANEFDVSMARYERAIAVATKAGDQDAIVDARIGLGNARSMHGDENGAMEQYRTAPKDFPQGKRIGEAFVAAIVILQEQNRASDIDAFFRDYADRFPDDPAVLNDYARRILDQKGDVASAARKATR